MKKSVLLLGLACCALGVAIGCNGGATSPPPVQVATHLSVTPSSANATVGTNLNVTVNALSASGSVASSYTGTVHFTSSDPQAVLPSDSPLTNGTGTFQVTFKTAGNQTVTASDPTNGLTSGTSSSISTSAAAVNHLSVNTSSASPAEGAPFSVIVSALDAFNNLNTTYSGTVKFSSSDPQASLPGPSKLTNGTGTFSVTLKTAGSQTITVTDTVTSSITGTSGTLTVSGPATHFAITAPGSTTTRATFSFGVTALDASNNVAASYTGTVHITSSDGQALLPANTALVNGATQLSATFETVGTQSITATDTATASLNGNSGPITVTVPPALSITSGQPPSGYVGSAYNPHLVRVCVIFSPPPIPRCEKWGLKEEFFFPLTSSGGVTPQGVTWSWAPASGSSLPPGLTIASANNWIAGTPAAGSAGTYNVVVTVTDTGTPPAQTSANYSITIYNAPPPVVNTTPPPPGGIENVAYSYTFTATGAAPLTWSESGPLPNGLTFNNSTGVLSGTPTVTGSFPVAITAIDEYKVNSAAADFTIVVTQHGFVATGSMATARLQHAATLLSGGKVLVTGGQQDTSTLYNSAELFDPVAGTFSSAGTMSTSRAEHTATLLCDLSASSCANKKVLIAGGESGSDGNIIGTAELYDPSANTFTLTGSMVTPRYGHTATLLPNGKVLITGGTDSTQAALSVAELYDPSTGAFTSTGPMTAARAYHTATLLTNGKVLVAGGSDVNSNALNSAELYDPSTGTFTATPNMNAARSSHTATLLNTGKVLLAGSTGPSGNSLDSAELYDPSANTFTTTGNLITARGQHTAVLLNDGTVLLAGGVLDAVLLSSAEVYDPASGTFSATGSLQIGLIYHAMTALSSNGLAIVIGGNGPNGPVASAEVYQ